MRVEIFSIRGGEGVRLFVTFAGGAGLLARRLHVSRFSISFPSQQQSKEMVSSELGGSGQREMAKICARVFGFKNQSRRNKEKLRVLTVINTFLRRASPTLLASGLVRDGHLSDVLWSG